ncbi:hypothetical protein C6P82_00850 [Burkholderia multivorans]|nr:hypothetical protein C6P82_00850 [Burkholderia multivorans]
MGTSPDCAVLGCGTGASGDGGRRQRDGSIFSRSDENVFSHRARGARWREKPRRFWCGFERVLARRVAVGGNGGSADQRARCDRRCRACDAGGCAEWRTSRAAVARLARVSAVFARALTVEMHSVSTGVAGGIFSSRLVRHVAPVFALTVRLHSVSTGFSSARGGAHRSNAQGLGSPVEAYIHIEIARFEWMRPMLTVRIHRHSSRLTRRMSTSRLHREASGKRACDGLVRAAAGLAAVFCRGGRRRSPLKCTVPRVVWSAGYPHRSFRREWRRPFGCGQPAHPRTRITVRFDGERRGRRADDMPAVTLIQCLKRPRAGTSSAPQSLPPAFLMSLTDVARGRRSVRDRTTTGATNGTGSKGLTARTPIHSRYAAAMRIAG